MATNTTKETKVVKTENAKLMLNLDPAMALRIRANALLSGKGISEFVTAWASTLPEIKKA